MAGGNLNEDIAQCLPVSVSLGGVKIASPPSIIPSASGELQCVEALVIRRWWKGKKHPDRFCGYDEGTWHFAGHGCSQ